MDPKSLERIERLNYIFGALLIFLCIFFAEIRFTLGVTIGVILTCVNFTIIRRLVDKLLGTAGSEQGKAAFYFVPKMAGVLLCISLAMYFLPISAIGLGIGFSIFLLSLLIESFRFITGTSQTN